MLARMTITIRLDESVSEQVNVVLQSDVDSLDDFKWAVQDAFGAGLLPNIDNLFKKIDARLNNKTHGGTPNCPPASPVKDDTVKPEIVDKISAESQNGQERPDNAPGDTNE